MLKTVILAFALLLALPAQAAWQLENKDSNLSFVSTKKSSVSEVHYFKSLSGNINDAGVTKVSIDLASVESNIPVRNTRMQNLLFEVSSFANANITTKIKTAEINALKVGETKVSKINFEVSLHGQTQLVPCVVRVVKLSQNRLWVSSEQPMIIKASQFGLEAGIAALQKVANLPSISTAVPVTFGLMFKIK